MSGRERERERGQSLLVVLAVVVVVIDSSICLEPARAADSITANWRD